MADNLTPEDIAQARFRTGLRGYDPAQVKSFLAQVAADFDRVKQDHDRVVARLAEMGDRDIQAEFDRVTEDIGRILAAARDAADALRQGALADAERWRSEARLAAEDKQRSSQLDAEALRGDAWTTSEELLKQSMAESERIRQGAERDALSILGEAEREAHRAVSGARREADDTLRVSKMEADRLLVDARGRHDEIIDEARKEAETAQERARALEVRRTELLTELESVRATIQRLERQVEERQAAATPEFDEPATVRVVPAGTLEGPEEIAEETESETSPGGSQARRTEWGTEDNVRIVEAPPRGEHAQVELPEGPVDATEVADEVRRLREAAEQVEPAPVGGAAGVSTDEVDRLFASLRAGETESEPEAQPAEAASEELTDRPVAIELDERPVAEGVADPFELRDRLLLPVINQALRAVKRRLTEAQNVALEELRTHRDWEATPQPLADRLADSLGGLVRDAFQAGGNAAGQLLNMELLEASPDGAVEDPTDAFAAELSEAVGEALQEARRTEMGPRQVASTVSRVYRSWRTDEAERGLHRIAADAYHRGLVGAFSQAGIARSTWQVAGRGCPTCRAAGEAGAVPLGEPFYDSFEVPPAHANCACTVLPA